jgi:hypothetical protein
MESDFERLDLDYFRNPCHILYRIYTFHLFGPDMVSDLEHPQFS